MPPFPTFCINLISRFQLVCFINKSHITIIVLDNYRALKTFLLPILLLTHYCTNQVTPLEITTEHYGLLVNPFHANNSVVSNTLIKATPCKGIVCLQIIWYPNSFFLNVNVTLVTLPPCRYKVEMSQCIQLLKPSPILYIHFLWVCLAYIDAKRIALWRGYSSIEIALDGT